MPLPLVNIDQIPWAGALSSERQRQLQDVLVDLQASSQGDSTPFRNIEGSEGNSGFISGLQTGETMMTPNGGHLVPERFGVNVEDFLQNAPPVQFGVVQVQQEEEVYPKNSDIKNF